jgi:hypothetical protein
MQALHTFCTLPFFSRQEIEMYIKSVNGFTGDGDFMSKFGVEIRDQVVFSVAQRRFKEDISSITTQPRPTEGDLVYFPLNNKCFQTVEVRPKAEEVLSSPESL